MRRSPRVLLKYLFSPVLGFPLYAVSFFIPRNKNKWAFGGHMGYNGNSKYLFIHVNKTQPDIHSLWICPDKTTLNFLREKGFSAYKRWSLKGIFHSLTAGRYFYTGYANDINFWTLGRAVDFNLWHGIGLKRVGFNIKNSMSAKTYNEKSIVNRIFLPFIFRRPKYVLSTSPFMSRDLLKDAFRVKQEQCIELGYPRTDMFFLPENEYREFLKAHESSVIPKTIAGFKAYDKVFLYTPTWRETRKSFLEDAFPDIKKLDDILQKKNYLMVMKLHYQTKIESILKQDLKNIIVLESSIDVYGLFRDIDVLITDYSSIYDDYLLSNKDVLLYPFDKEEYIKDGNGLIADYDDYKLGLQVHTFDAFCHAIESDADMSIPDYGWLRKQFWADYKGNASEKIVKFVKNV